MKKIANTYGLIISEHSENGFFHITARPVLLGLDAWERQCIDAGQSHGDSTHATIRNPRNDSTRGAMLDLQDLEISSQGENDRADRGLYAFSVRFRDRTFVELSDAKSMAHTLTTIFRKLDKARDEHGHPSTFGAYVARVAHAIGATQILLETSTRGSFYHDSEYRRLTIGEGADHINFLERRWAEKHASVAS